MARFWEDVVMGGWLALWLLGGVLDSMAAITIDGDSFEYISLEAALDAAPDGATVRMSAGTYVLEPYTLEKDVTVVGEGAVATGGTDGLPMFLTSAHQLGLEGLTFEDIEGRLVQVSSGGGLVLQDVVVRDILSDNSDLLLWMNSESVVVIDNCLFENISSLADSPSPWIHQVGGTLQLTETRFNDFLGINGSAIVSEAGQLEVEGSWFTSMTLRAIELRVGSTGEVRDTLFEGLWSLEGGAVRVEGSTLMMEGSTFLNNASLGGSGGAVYGEDAVLDLTANRFEANGSIQDGGALLARMSTVELKENQWFYNHAEERGGAVWAEDVSGLSSLGNDYCGNEDDEVAGALGVSGGVVTRLVNDRYVSNVSGGAGAIHVDLDEPVLMAHHTAAANQGTFADFLSAGGTTAVEVRLSVFLDHEGFLAEPLDDASVSFDRVIYWPNEGVGSVSTGSFVDRVDPILPFELHAGCEGRTLWPSLESPMIDPAFNVGERRDHDGSVADLGFLGGPHSPLEPWQDTDGDGSPLWMDCAPDDPARSPLEEERCTGLDEDCDGWIDEEDPSLVPEFWLFLDQDEDGYGTSEESGVPGCSIWEGYASWTGDCDDADEAIHPDAEERCDEVDRNCDGDPQEGAADSLLVHPDLDGDGYGSGAVSSWVCTVPNGHLLDGSDCDDSDGSIHPKAPEYCDLIDQDCDGQPADDESLDASTWHRDQDGDGYGNPDQKVRACAVPSGFVDDRGDCDDHAPRVHPAAREVARDGIDQDCDGKDIDVLAMGACSQGFSGGSLPPLSLVLAWTTVIVMRRRTPCG